MAYLVRRVRLHIWFPARLRTHLLDLLFETLLQVLVTPDQLVKNLSGQDVNGFSDDSRTCDGISTAMCHYRS